VHEVISEFRGEYAFLSNYDVNPFYWRGLCFHSGEQAFAYAKTFFVPAGRQEIFQKNILAAKTPGDAKKFGRGAPINVVEWDTRKVHYMREIVHAKIGYVKDYAGKLINTGTSPLVEGNTWSDGFWGRYRNKDGVIVGLNMLGVILMEERGYWLWGRQDCGHVVESDSLTAEQMERIADYG
jgi:ribA/ribD-fused uncharacterized protein